MPKALRKVLLSPNERFTLCNLLHNPDVPVKSSLEGKALRRTLRALGMDSIRKAIVANNGKVATKHASDTASACLFELTEEGVDVIKTRISAHPRKPHEEFAVGEFLDGLDASDAADQEGLALDPASENWNPPALEELVDLTDEQIDGMKKILTDKQFKVLFG